MSDGAFALLDKAIDLYEPVAVYGMFSGGDDSLTATHLVKEHPAFTAAAHINTGIGIEETRNFVRRSCGGQLACPLKEYCSWEQPSNRVVRYRDGSGEQIQVPVGPEPIDLWKTLCLTFGFPGPPGHNLMYQRLKERCVEQLVRDSRKRGEGPVLLVTGGRSDESTRRMGHVEPIQAVLNKNIVWVAIIHDWDKGECLEYLQANKIERNPVVELIHKSGECLCGAFAIPPERPYTGDRGEEWRELEMWFRSLTDEIRTIERQVRERGFCWNWDERAPKWFEDYKRGQGILFPMHDDEPAFSPLCVGCGKRQEESERGA